MPSATKQITHTHPSTVQSSNTKVSASTTIPSNCMRASVKKTRVRSKKRTGRTRRTSNKDRKKMLPVRVARLLVSNKSGVVKFGKKVISAGKGGQIGALAKSKSVNNRSVCNVNIDAQNVTYSTLSRCQGTCGTLLCIGVDSTNGPATKSLSTNSLNSTRANEDLPSNSSNVSVKYEKVVAIDCEMVGVGEQGSCNALARCSIVNYEGHVLYDKYVKPDMRITDYRTPWSGIVPQHMDNAIPLDQAQTEVMNILKNKIVVGHDIRNDFKVLKLEHPEQDVRDTSKYRGLRYLCGENHQKRSVGLKAMTERLMGKKIQTGPHCSVEDARATMSLYRLVCGQWEEDSISLYPEKQFRAGFMDDHFWPEDLD